jgi:hypothetical protein
VELPSGTLTAVTISGGNGKLDAAGSGTTITTVTIGGDLTLDSGTLTVGSGGALNVPEDGSLTVDGAELVITSGAGGELKGTIIIESGASLKDEKPGGGSSWADSDSTGSYVIQGGAKAYSSGSSTPTIGVAGDSNVTLALDTNAVLTMTKDGYELNGNATLKEVFGISEGMTLHITSGSVLTYSPSGNDLYTKGTLVVSGTLQLDGEITVDGSNPARILLAADSAASVDPTINIGTNGTNNFYNADDSPVTSPAITVTIPGSGTTYADYRWDTGVNGWKKQ